MFSPSVLIYHSFREINHSLKIINFGDGCLHTCFILLSHSGTLLWHFISNPWPFHYWYRSGTLWNKHLSHLAERLPRYVGVDWGVLQLGFSSWELWDPLKPQDRHRGGGQLRGLPMIHILALHHPSPLSCYHSYTATTYADEKNEDKNMFVCIDAEIAEKNTHTHRHGDTHSWPAQLSGSFSFIQRCQASCANWVWKRGVGGE